MKKLQIKCFTVWNIIHRNEEINIHIERAWKNIFATLEKKMLECDNNDVALNENENEKNNDLIQLPANKSYLCDIPSTDNLVEDSAIDYSVDSGITRCSSVELMERKNELFKELSTIEDTMLDYLNTIQTNIDKTLKPVTLELLKQTKNHSETVNNNGKLYSYFKTTNVTI